MFVLDIQCVTYFLTSIIMSDPQTSHMHQIWQMMSAHPLASARLSKLQILRLYDLLGEIYVKKYLLSPYFLFSGLQTLFCQMH